MNNVQPVTHMHCLMTFDYELVRSFVDGTRSSYGIQVESATTTETLAAIANGFDESPETEL